MGAGRVFVADALDDGDLALVPQVLDCSDVGVESQGVVDGQHLVGGDAHVGPRVVVVGIGVGHHRAQRIVSPGELQYYQDGVSLGCGHYLLLPRFAVWADWLGRAGAPAQRDLGKLVLS